MYPSLQMKTVAIVVAFNPSEEEFLGNLRSYAPFVDKVLLWRNSELGFDIPEDLEGKVDLCGDCSNAYLAKPYNHALRWAMDNGFDYLLTMDQDSRWSDFGAFLDKALSLHEDDVAIYAPNPNGQFPVDRVILPVDFVMTSGSMCNVKACSRLGGFREDYQIYWLDSEFCCRAVRNGFSIKVLTGSYLKHQLGHGRKIAFGWTTADYSPQVYYFIFRNMFWMRREYKDNPCLKSIIHYSLHYFRGILLGEKQKGRKFASIFKGIRHGLFSPIARRISQVI